MSERARRARTLSEEVRAEAGGDGGPCAPNLHVCGYKELERLDDEVGGLAGVVCCERDAVPADPPFPRLHFPLAASAYLVDVPSARLVELVRFVDKARAEGAAAIHCTHGRGRSVAVAVVYLVAKGMALHEALLRVARSRPHIDCTTGLVAMLERVSERMAGVGLAAGAKKDPACEAAGNSDAGK